MCSSDLFQMNPSIIEKIISNIKDLLFESIEIDAYKRLETGSAMAVVKKVELTEDLEGRLRNHW